MSEENCGRFLKVPEIIKVSFDIKLPKARKGICVSPVASCKWRNAQCATDNLSVILWDLWKGIWGRLFDSKWGWGGGAVKFCLDR